MPRIPASIEHFVQQQTTLPIAELGKGPEEPYRPAYGSYWYRAVLW